MRHPQFAALLGLICDGETLVVPKLDRIGRDAMDVAATVKMLAQRKIEAIVLQLGKLDLNSLTIKFMLKIPSALAKMARDLLV